MEDDIIPRRRNLRPRKRFSFGESTPPKPRNLRRSRAKLNPKDFVVFDNAEDDDWDVSEEPEEPVLPARHTRRSRRRSITPLPSRSPSPATLPPPRQRKPRKPVILLPEDVEGRDLQPQPTPDPEEIKYCPSVAFLCIFIVTFYDVFNDIPKIPSPQELEEGLLSEQPSEIAEFMFRRLLGLVLNRKKEIEVGRYASALSELHSLRSTLGLGAGFPQLNWKSKGNAFAEMSWQDRVEMLHILAHWTLCHSEKVKSVLKYLDEESTTPWIAADDAGNHYYFVGFIPLCDGSEERTKFRLYKETNRLLNTVKWEPLASNHQEILQFLEKHEIKGETGKETGNENAEGEFQSQSLRGENEEEQVKEEITESTDKGDKEDAGKEAVKEETTENNTDVSTTAEQTEQTEQTGDVPAEPKSYNLPQPLVDFLLQVEPLMPISEKVAEERYIKEAKRLRKKQFFQRTTSEIEGRYAGRTRRRRVDYAEYLRETTGGFSDDEYDDDDNLPARKRRLRNRGKNYEWQQPGPETRQQRHARLLAERVERESRVQSKAQQSDEEKAESEPEVESENENEDNDNGSNNNGSSGHEATVEQNVSETLDTPMATQAPAPAPVPVAPQAAQASQPAPTPQFQQPATYSAPSNPPNEFPPPNYPVQNQPNMQYPRDPNPIHVGNPNPIGSPRPTNGPQPVNNILGNPMSIPPIGRPMQNLPPQYNRNHMMNQPPYMPAHLGGGNVRTPQEFRQEFRSDLGSSNQGNNAPFNYIPPPNDTDRR